MKSEQVAKRRQLWRGDTMDEKQRNKRLEMIRERFSKNVAILRRRKEWSQQELADRVGIHRVTVARIETAVHHPSFAEACLMADLLGVSIGEMRAEMFED